MNAEEMKSKQHEAWVKNAAGYSAGVIESRCIAEIYDAYVQHLTPALKDLSGDVQVLDVASASGEPALSLARVLPNAKFTSTDLAETYIPLATEHAKQQAIENIKFEAADGENLPYTDNTFDALTCSLGLMFMPSEGKALAEFLRVMKPNGNFAATVWGSNENVPFMNVCMAVASRFDPSLASTSVTNTATRFGDALGLVATVKETGFVDVTHKIMQVSFKYGPHWFEEILATPIPLKVAFEKAIEQGTLASLEDGKAALEAKFKEAGFMQSDGTVSAGGNICHFISARSPA